MEKGQSEILDQPLAARHACRTARRLDANSCPAIVKGASFARAPASQLPGRKKQGSSSGTYVDAGQGQTGSEASADEQKGKDEEAAAKWPPRRSKQDLAHPNVEMAMKFL